MIILIGAISVFGLGWILNDLMHVPTLVVIAVCLAAQVGILVANNKRTKK